MRARAVVLMALLAVVALGAAAVLSTLWQDAQPSATSAEIRLVSLSPSITATLGEIGAGDLQVARTEWCSWPQQVADLPIVGSGLNPDFEAIVAARPSQILVEGSASAPIADLKALAPTVVLPWLTLSEVQASTRKIGEIAGKPVEAEALVARYEARLGGEVAGADAPSVLLVMGGEGLGQRGLWFIKSNSVHGNALRALGVRNAVPEEISGEPVLSLERLVQIDPDVIVVLIHGELDDAARERTRHAFDHLQPLTAPKEGKVVVVSGPRLLTPGPMVLDYVDLLESGLRAVDIQP